jgi:protein-S-isoprenylcysteine O-methyltransferase Ste14
LTRHPIYLGEIIAGVGLVLPTLLTMHVLLFAVFLGAQIVRTHFEERILRSTYPQYEAYAARTHRLIPFVI